VPDDDALVFYRQIGRFARKNLRSGGKLWLEINESYPRQVQELLCEQGFSNVEIYQDFRDKMRFVSAVNEK
jgi:release factor glutamine methyltransferase